MKTSLISVLHVENDAQVLNQTSASLSAVTVISLITKIYASEYSQKIDLILSVSNLIELVWLYLPFAVSLSSTYHGFVANLDSLLL